MSLPVRGAWVEIDLEAFRLVCPCRSPCGERGLKLHLLDESTHLGRSLPVRGAWVEITGGKGDAESYIVAPRAGSVG